MYNSKSNIPFIPSVIYFDTNILLQFIYGMSNSEFMDLKSKAEFIKSKFCIPKIVLDETIYHYYIGPSFK